MIKTLIGSAQLSLAQRSTKSSSDAGLIEMQYSSGHDPTAACVETSPW